MVVVKLHSTPPDVMRQIIEEMEQAEQNHFFDGLFDGTIPEPQYSNKEELLNSIKPHIGLTMGFFKKVYGYTISQADFCEIVISRLESIGCTKAREYYNSFVAEFERKDREVARNVGEWYRKQIDEEYERYLKENRSDDVRKQDLTAMSDSELLQMYLLNLKEEDMR